MNFKSLILLGMTLSFMGATVHVIAFTPTIPHNGCSLEAVVTSTAPDNHQWNAGTYNIYACTTPTDVVQWCTQIATVNEFKIFSCMVQDN